VTIGPDCVLHPRVVVLAGSMLGSRVTVQAGTVIGSDGYGYRWDGMRHRKVPQVGRVVIGDDVEIGANCAIDRGALGETVIGAGTKIDNLVHVGHNVRIGEHCLIIAQVGLSGSARVGRRVILAGQVGVADHSEIGDGTIAVAKSGIHGRVGAGEVVAGYPALPHAVWRRVSAALPRLPELVRAVRRLERKEPR
jgi:UDP-3-O-[3-hydroxymyristoyl] glucosamine N-acyltransferase